MSIITLTCLLAIFGQACLATTPENLVEVLFVVDKAVVQKYIDLAEGDERSVQTKVATDSDYFISEINKIFERIEGLSIAVEKRDIVILDSNINEGTRVERHGGLKKFDAWRKEHNTYDTYKYDIAVLWTGAELVNEKDDPSTAGYANVGKVCEPASSSLIAEFDMTYNTVLVTAHELGHVLGSGHDKDTLRKVMGPEAAASSPNRWTFSDLSAKNMADTIKGLATNCLLETDPNSKIVDSKSPADLTNPDTICRRAQNDPTSYMTKSHLMYDGQPPHGDTICKAIYCYGGSPDDYRAAYASDGMVCGKNKRCHEGKCTGDADAESGSVSDDCVFGDQKHIDMAAFSGTCEELIEKFGKRVCYGFKSACCATCAKLKSEDESCPFGDKSRKCAGKEQARVCGGSAKTCCELCKGWEAKRSADDDSTEITPDELPQMNPKKTGEEEATEKLR